jgi:hypothetical protein
MSKLTLSTLLVLICQLAVAGSIEMVEQFTLPALNDLAVSMKAISNFEISGDCGGWEKLRYDDEVMLTPAIFSAVGMKNTRKVVLTPADLKQVKAVFLDLIREKEKEARVDGIQQWLQLIQKAQTTLDAVERLQGLSFFIGSTEGQFKSSHTFFVIVDTVNKEVFAFMDGHCD